MTHNGFYIDEKQPPKGRCKPYLVGKDRKKRVRKKVKTSAGATRIVKRRIDPTEGVPNRKWGHDARHLLRRQVRLRPVRAAVRGAGARPGRQPRADRELPVPAGRPRRAGRARRCRRP